MSAYGSAEIKAHYKEGTSEVDHLEVVSADRVIGISVELLAQAVGHGLYVDGDGLLWLAGDPRYKYRPVRFECSVGGLTADQAVEGTRVLICERVGP